METQRTRALRVAAIGRTGRGDWGHAIDQLWQNRLDAKVVAVADDSPDGLTQACVRHGLEKNADFPVFPHDIPCGQCEDWNKIKNYLRLPSLDDDFREPKPTLPTHLPFNRSNKESVTVETFLCSSKFAQRSKLIYFVFKY